MLIHHNTTLGSFKSLKFGHVSVPQEIAGLVHYFSQIDWTNW